MASTAPSANFNAAPSLAVTRSMVRPFVSRTISRAPEVRSTSSVADPARVWLVKSAATSRVTWVTRASHGRAYEWMSRSAGVVSVMGGFSRLPALHAAAATTAESRSQRGMRTAYRSWTALGLGPWALVQCLREAHEVGEHPVGTRDAGGELPEPRVRR